MPLVYDPEKDEWQDLASLPTPRGAGWAVELNGKIYLIGGAQVNARGNPPLHSSQAPRSWF